MHSRLYRYYFSLMGLVFLQHVDGQELYKIVSGTWLHKFDIQNCSFEEIHDFKDFNSQHMSGIQDISFHPDGRLYLSGGKFIIVYNVVRNRVEEIIPFTELNYFEVGYNLFTIDEEGRIIWSDHQNNPNTFKIIDLRHFRTSSLPDDEKILNNSSYTGIDGLLPDGNYILFGGTSDLSANKVIVWNPELDSNVFINIDHSTLYGIRYPHIYYPACEPLQLIGAGYQGSDFESILLINLETQTMEEICPELDPYYGRAYSAHPTDFRQSPLRIDLDADNSSGHITAGYYDTLTTCPGLMVLT